MLKIYQNVSPVKEKMVSPYTSFIQIKALQPDSINPQLSLKGSVVNVQAEVNDTI